VKTFADEAKNAIYFSITLDWTPDILVQVIHMDQLAVIRYGKPNGEITESFFSLRL
jgi:hypothetical protein